MFRIGSALFIPGYLTVTLYRPFASENSDGGVVLMGGECVAVALRFLMNSLYFLQPLRSARKFSEPPWFPSLTMGMPV